MTTLKEWFCLKEGRKNFKPQVWQDRELIFCHQAEMQDTILKSIEKRFAADEPIKMMLYGDWGVGKTHAVNHIAWWLDTKKAEYPAYALIVELSDVTKKSRFDTLVRPFLDKLGLDGLIKLVHDYERS
jgi:Cdc6-like AAA superfamily ATPase